MGIFNKYPYTDMHELNLDWIIKTVKELSANWETTRTLWNSTQEAWNDLHDYVMNYFNNLDVQDEINNKITAMVNSGEFFAIIKPYLDAEINNRLNSQDAKIEVLNGRMDTFASLTEGSTTGDAELQDIRVMIDGQSAPTAGDAVRSQVSELKEDLNDVDARLTESMNDIMNGAEKLITFSAGGQQILVDTFFIVGDEYIITNNTSGGTGEIRAVKNDGTYKIITPYIGAGGSFKFCVDESYLGFTKIRLFANTSGTFTITNLGAVSRINAAEKSLGECLFQRVKIPSNNDLRFACYIPLGCKFRVETLDGNNFSKTTTLRLLDENGVDFDYYTLYNTTSYRESIMDGDKDGYFVRIQTKVTNPIRITVYLPSTLEGRVTALESNVESILDKKLPNYYDSYMSSRISDIQLKDITVGSDGDSFIFITDIHDQNQGQSPLMVKQIIENTNVTRLVLGGDYINEPSSKKLALKYLRERIKKFSVLKDTIVLCGNHDSNPYGTGQVSYNELYPLLCRNIEKYTNTNKQLYYFVDNESQKIRYYCLNSKTTGASDTTQENWFANSLETLDASWTIVIFIHDGITTPAKDDRTNIITSNLLNRIHSVLLNVSCSIACVVCGHSHIDIQDTTRRYPVICTTCDACGIQSSAGSSDDRTIGTINEQAFDVFHIDTSNRKVYVTRFGGGQNNVIGGSDYTLNDREFNY